MDAERVSRRRFLVRRKQKNRLDDCPEIPVQLLRFLLPASPYPPEHHFHEASGNLVLATPTAIMAAIGQATRHGVIIKSGEALEKMGRADTIAFDKTGTLTYGRLEVCDVISCGASVDAETLLALAASAESKSEHPLGKAVVVAAKDRNLPLRSPEAFSMSGGRGIAALLYDRRFE